MNLKPYVLAFSCFSLTAAVSSELVIDLKSPEYVQGTIKTEHGGVISAPCLRIQAEKIAFTDTKDKQIIIAEGNLLMEYDGQVFTADKIHFDLLSRTGYLINGRTQIDQWYVGGERVDLYCDGSFIIQCAFVTTCVDYDNPWKIQAQTATVKEGYLLSATSVSFKVLDFPLLWLPGYKSNLKNFNDPMIRYRILWDTGLGPRLSARYRFYSTETFSAFARFDYRLTRGPGGALEAEYASDDGLSFFQTRNYGALDKTFQNENGPVRYRFQGIYKTKNAKDSTKFHMQWDKLSDDRMVGDFRDSDFEVNTQKATYLEFSQYQPYFFTNLNVRPRINNFQSMNQELPYAVFGLHPFTLGPTKIVMENYGSVSYLDYTFANVVESALKSRKSGRLETINTIYRPFSLGACTITPKAGLVGIYYTQSPQHHPASQLIGSYGVDANFRFARYFENYRHMAEPYAEFFGYTRPQTPVNDYFVFDISDGYTTLNQCRFGVRQLLFNRANTPFLPTAKVDVYAYAFWHAKSFDTRIPKVFADMEFNQPSYAIYSQLCWNIQEKVLDCGNVRLLWTINASLALGAEFRHRSEFYWRKAVPNNFIVDCARPLDILLLSPLSDRRNTFLASAHLRLTPRWHLQLQTHHGWDRVNEPGYHGAKVDLYTLLPGNWQMRLTYEYLPNDPYRFSYGFKLIK